VTPVARAVVHPVTLASLAVLLVNDHVLKAAFPGPITGKLSDFAGLAFIPVVAAFAVRGRGVRAVAIAALVVCSAFAAVKTSQAACDVYAQAVGTARWILAAPAQIMRGEALLPPSAGVVMRDPTDLLALPFGLIGVILTSRAAKRTANTRAHCMPAQATHIGLS
jgi:hypothetical protein